MNVPNIKKMICVIVLIMLFLPKTGLCRSKNDYIKHYVKSAYGKKANLILKIIERESNFNPKTINDSCVGLMQVNTQVWFSKNPKYNLIKLGVIESKKDLLNYKMNIRAGVHILKFYNWNYRKYRGIK